MRNVPDISVVIPTCNRPHLLVRAIDSVLRQTLQTFEIIVVLDGYDRTAVMPTFADPRIHVITLECPVGGSEARNLGARAAGGRYIALLDDDDEWLPEKLQSQLALADAHRGSNFIVVTRYVYRAERRPDEIWPGHFPRAGEPLSEFLFSSRGGFQTSTYLCPRELFLRMPFTAGLRKHQDWDWFLRLAALPDFRLLVVPEPLSIYHVPSPSRASISGNLDWQCSHRWATAQRSLMTRKAYSRFLVKICARSAVQQHAGPLALNAILRDMILLGRATPFLLAEFLVAIFLPNHLRLQLRFTLCGRRTTHPRLSKA